MRRLAPWVALVVAGAAGCAGGHDGARLFAAACARCHGPDGSGGRPVVVGGRPARDLRDPAFQRTRSDADLRATIRGGRGTDMPPFATVYDAAQIDALVRQVRHLGARR